MIKLRPKINSNNQNMINYNNNMKLSNKINKMKYNN